MKQVIIIRKDLNMRKGKMIAQGCHASLKVYKRYKDTDPDKFKLWEIGGETKIVVGVDSGQELVNLYAEAQLQGLFSAIIRDEGRTEFKEPTLTAVAIGPGDNIIIDKITGHLKLL